MGQAGATLTNATTVGNGVTINFGVGDRQPQNYCISIQANNNPDFVIRFEGQRSNGGWSPIGTYTAPGDFPILSMPNPARNNALTPPTPYAGIRGNLLAIGPKYAGAPAQFSAQIAGNIMTVDAGTIVGTIAVGQFVYAAPGAPALLPGTYIVSGSALRWTLNNSQTVADQAMFGTPQPSVSMQVGGGP